MKSKLINLFLIYPFLTFAIPTLEWPILKVISEPENESIYRVNLILDLFEEINMLKIQGPIENEFFGFNHIVRGIVVFKKENRDILFLECPLCDKIYGGEIKIKFLKNALKNQYSEIFLDLEKKDGKWGVFSSFTNIPIKSIRLKSNKLLGQIIGIKEIEINPK